MPSSHHVISPDSLTLQAVEEEEEEDGEYNFLADCLREEEREEFRNDRAVRIPRTQCNPFTYIHCLHRQYVHTHLARLGATIECTQICMQIVRAQ